jgi:hypothetical protein
VTSAHAYVPIWPAVRLRLSFGLMSDVRERIEADGPVVTARRFLRRRLVRDLTLLLVGLLLLAAGITGFAVVANQSDELAATGIRATATAVAVLPHNSRFQWNEHVDVTFRAAGNRAVIARCYTSGGDQFAVGDPVVITYDPHNPTHAQLAIDPSLGPIGLPLLAAIVLGLLLALPAALALRTRRGTKTALQTPPTPMTAIRTTRHHLTLKTPQTTTELRPHGQTRKIPTNKPTEVQTFGTPTKTMIIINPKTNSVIYGRPPKNA